MVKDSRTRLAPILIPVICDVCICAVRKENKRRSIAAVIIIYFGTFDSRPGPTVPLLLIVRRKQERRKVYPRAFD